MNRTRRLQIAEQTVEIIERGSYQLAEGTIDISDQVRACLDGTRLYWPEDLERIRSSTPASPDRSTVIEVVNETTLAGIRRLRSQTSEPIAALNFASARHPGGGFLNGSQAQEESLARSSALYASLQRAPEFYRRHSASQSLLYSHAMILSPGCPIIRDDSGDLLDPPHAVSFITSAAPNASAIANNCPDDLGHIPRTFRERAEHVLALAASEGYRHLVLGAWGCGVFGNDPQLVAMIFADHLRRGPWGGHFDHVLFSVLDNTPSQATFSTFQTALTH